MANEVYTQALEGVQRLVSAKAAARALNGALRTKGETPDTVSAEAMSRILLGPILSEFETILPREGLKRQLRSLAAGLRKRFPEAPPEPAAEPAVPDEAHGVSADEAALVEAEEDVSPPEHDVTDFIYQTNALSEVPESLDLMFSVTSSSVRTPQAPADVRREDTERATRAEPEVLDALVELPEELLDIPEELLEPEEPEVDPAPAADLPIRVSQEQLETAVLRLAQLEQVRFVAALRPDGQVASQRGSGLDVDALAQLGLVGLRLLRRSGPLRTYYLAHTCGQLFLLPVGEDTLALVGTPELNVGAVFNTFTSLKEEL